MESSSSHATPTARTSESDRELIEELLAEDLTFYSPPDPGIDRESISNAAGRTAGMIDSFEIVRLIESGDEVIVTYESTKTDGNRSRNTEVLTFAGDKIAGTRSTSAGTWNERGAAPASVADARDRGAERPRQHDRELVQEQQRHQLDQHRDRVGSG